MLARAERKTTFHLPASPRASAKPRGAELPVRMHPGQSRFPHLQEVAPSTSNHKTFDFDNIFRTYQRTVYSKCFRILRNHGDAEDVVQEVFLQLLRKADTFRGEAKFSTWLHRLTINTVLMQLRKLRRNEMRTTPLEDTPNGDDGNVMGFEVANLPHAAGTISADRVSLLMAISQLPNGYREVFSLHDVEGYTHAEISQLLGISLGTSKSQLHKARLRLRILLQHGFKDKLPATAEAETVAPPLEPEKEDQAFTTEVLDFGYSEEHEPAPAMFEQLSETLVAVAP